MAFLFLGVPYDAVASDENRSGEPPEEPEGPEASGFEALLYSLADALQTKQSKEAIALLIKNYADDVRARRRRLAWLTVGGWVVTLLVISALGILSYLKLISVETTAALIGIVIGSLFRRNV